MKALIDTCVIIDALQHRVPFHEDAERIFLLVANQQIEGYITAKAATDIYYLSHRNTHSDEESRRILANLFSLFALLDTCGTDCRQALSSSMSDYEDAVMAESGMRSGMDCIVTRNPKDYRSGTLPVYTPQDFLAFLESDFSMN